MRKTDRNTTTTSFHSIVFHHFEKLILGVSSIALLVFCVDGWQTQTYQSLQPTELLELAQRANEHIHDQQSWNHIASFRPAEKNALQKIESRTGKIDSDVYQIAKFNTRLKTASLRSDPILFPVEHLVAKVITSPVLLNVKSKSPFENLTLANSRSNRSSNDGQGQAGNGLGDEPGQESSPPNRNPNEPGDSVPEIMEHETLGVRPNAPSTPNSQSVVATMVAVTGIVDVQKQFDEYRNAFEDSIGYYPLRDRPRFVYVEIQRREVDGDWKDISEQFFEHLYGLDPGAPEVVHHEQFDPTISRPIPPILLADYRKLATHPETRIRQTVPSEFDQRNLRTSSPDQSESLFDPQNTENSTQPEAENIELLKGNNRENYNRLNPISIPKAQFKLVRFFDFLAEEGKSYQYRVRIWFNDANQENQFTFEDEKSNTRANQPAGFGIGDESNQSDETQEQDSEDLSQFEFIAVKPSMLQRSVRKRLKDKTADPQLPELNLRTSNDQQKMERLRAIKTRLSKAWASPWSLPSPVVKVVARRYEFHLGGNQPIRLTSSFGQQFQVGEPVAELFSSVWSRKYETRVPVRSISRRGDVLNRSQNKIHILDPKTQKVYRLDEQQDIADRTVNSNAVVVDIIQANNTRRKSLGSIPNEVLLMRQDGTFQLCNSSEDLQATRHLMFRQDELKEAPLPKARRSR